MSPSTDSVEQFREFAAEHGLDVPKHIEPEKIVRFSTNDKSDDDAGWAFMFEDMRGGIVGDHRTQQQYTWQSKQYQHLPPKEMRELSEQIERSKAQREKKRAQQIEAVAVQADALWAQNPTPATEKFPYLAAKGVLSYGLRIYRGDLELAGMKCNGALMMPLRNIAGNIRNLQFIDAGGEKRFLAGARDAGTFHTIGFPHEAICIAEGYATAASIFAATKFAVHIACDCGNLLSVAKTIQSKTPAAKLILCADNDPTICPRHKKEGATEALSPLRPRPEWCRCNPGLTAALEAARAVGGLVAIPEPKAGSDFNDWAREAGPEVIKTAISQAIRPPEPQAPVLQVSAPQTTTTSSAQPKSADAGFTAAASQVSTSSTPKSDEVRDGSIDDAEIARLANLSPLEFDRVREATAKRLGVRAATLDAAVKEKRGSGKAEAGLGQRLTFDSPEPWSEPVDGAELLNAMAASAKRHLVLPPHGEIALALWVVFTYTLDTAYTAAILALPSPEKGCGKTTLLDWLARLVFRPLPASSISPAAVFRTIEACAPTLLIDEGDAFLRDNEELRGVLNSGHTRPTAFVIRTVGEDHEPRRFSTWGAKAIAMIGRLPDTLADRSIPVEMQRKKPSERVQKIAPYEAQFKDLARKCAKFANDNLSALTGAKPAIPDGLGDRAADNWTPLLAIAEIAGGDWPQRARDAASVLSGISPDGDSLKVALLRDVKAVFTQGGNDRLSSAALAGALAADKEKRWCEYHHGQPITMRQLAKLLEPFGVRPNTVRFDDGITAKGYHLEDFADAFARYLPPLDPSQRHNALSTLVSEDLASVTEKKLLRIADPSQRPIHAGCDGVTDRNPLLGGGDERIEPDSAAVADGEVVA